MRDLLSEIERAVKARGWSARQASMHAVGTPELIHDMRRGRVPSVEGFRTLCQALELEFYVGPPREGGYVDAARLSRALETTERALASTGRRMGHADKARAVSAVYDLMSRGYVGRVNTFSDYVLISETSSRVLEYLSKIMS